MGILNKKSEDDDELPGSGMRMDLDTKVCPECRREAMPWEDRCPACGVATVSPEDVPATEIALPPGLRALAEEDALDEGSGEGSGEGSDEEPDGA